MNARAPQLLFCITCSLLLATGCAPSRKDSSVVSQADQFHQSLAPAAMKDEALDIYLQTVGGRIVGSAKKTDAAKMGPESHFQGETKWMFENVHFYLVNSKTLNAFTTGGHAVYIYNELFQLCQNEEQLAAVMSHEFAHIYCRHVQKGMNHQLAMSAVTYTAAGAGYLAGGEDYAQKGMAAGSALGNFIDMGFTREDEAQADEYGHLFYTGAGWDPNNFGVFFQVMKDKVGDVSSDLTSDHPSLTSRVEAAKKRAVKLSEHRPSPIPPPVVNQGQFRQLQAVAMRVSTQMPNDTQVLNTKKLLQALPRSCWIPVPQPDQQAAQKELLDKAKAAQPAAQGK